MNFNQTTQYLQEKAIRVLGASLASISYKIMLGVNYV